MKREFLIGLLTLVLLVPLSGYVPVIENKAAWAAPGEVTLEILNPVGIKVTEAITPASRPETLDGKRIMMYWNGKGNGWKLRKTVQKELEKSIKGAEYIKFDQELLFTSASPEELRQVKAAKPDAVIFFWHA